LGGQQELLDDQASLNGLAETDVVEDAEVHPWHLQGAHHGVELVVLQRDARAERCLQGTGVGGGDGPPADGIQEGREPLGRVETAGDRFRKGRGGQRPRTGFELPDDGLDLAEAVVLDGGKGDQVLATFTAGRENIQG
jgi:hypothetical protein